MPKTKRISKVLSRYVILFILVCLCASMGWLLINHGKNSDKKVTINYEENSDIDYKVYLKKNSFFETPYLEKNRTYIASLIDYIWVDFKYSFKVDQNVKGEYSYYLKGVVSANKDDSNDYYWSKEYTLSKKVTKKYEDSKKVNIDINNKINYQLYNNLLNDFKSQYGITTDGFLKVSLVIENNIESDLVERKIDKKSVVELNIPLTLLTIEIPIETNELNKKGTLINDIVKENEIYYESVKYLGYICYVIAFAIVFYMFWCIIKRASLENKFNKELRKILKTYDNIIVNTSCLPDIHTLNMILVTSFEELIDAHSEVRNPINFVLEKDRAIFILINEGIAWRYDLIKKNKEDSKDETNKI